MNRKKSARKWTAARVALGRLVGLLKSKPFLNEKAKDRNGDTDNYAQHDFPDGLIVPVVAGVLGALVVLSFF